MRNLCIKLLIFAFVLILGAESMDARKKNSASVSPMHPYKPVEFVIAPFNNADHKNFEAFLKEANSKIKEGDYGTALYYLKEAKKFAESSTDASFKRWYNAYDYKQGKELDKLIRDTEAKYKLQPPQNANNSNKSTNSSSGSNSTPSVVNPAPKHTCTSCGGNGICPICKGTGKNIGYKGNIHECGGCYGTGKCFNCGGNGYLGYDY